MKIKKNDKVLIIKGKDRTKSGKVIKVFPKDSRVIVEGLNIQKKTVRPKREGEKGQIISVAMPIMSHNVELMCPSCGKASKVGSRVAKKGHIKERYCKKCKSTV
jgi:large subunit ribosomal protein L24